MGAGFRLKEHRTARAFAAVAEELLLLDEASHSLMLGLIGAIDRGDYSDSFLAVVRRNNEAVLAVMRTPPHNLLVSHPAHSEAGAWLASQLARHSVDLPGVQGPIAASGAFAAAWHRLRGGEVNLLLRLGSYRAERISAPSGIPGRPTLATLDDLDLLVDWLQAMHHEALSHAPKTDFRGRLAKTLAAPCLDREYWLWRVGNQPVTMAAVGNPSRNGIRIAAVYTPPEHRRNGYASALVSFVSSRQLEAGRRFCFLYTDLANLTSNRVYRSLGYRPIAELHEYRFVPTG